MLYIKLMIFLRIDRIYFPYNYALHQHICTLYKQSRVRFITHKLKDLFLILDARVDIKTAFMLEIYTKKYRV